MEKKKLFVAKSNTPNERVCVIGNHWL